MLHNLLLIIVGCGFLLLGVLWVFQLCKKTREQRIANILEWLKIAVIHAEKDLGSGTGKLKLRTVYESAITKFPWIVTIMTFDQFSLLVDSALSWMKIEIEKNKAIKEYVSKREDIYDQEG